MTALCEGCGVGRTKAKCYRFCSKACANRATGARLKGVIKATPSERFWAKVDKSGECWLWCGSRLPDGYGHFGIDRRTTVLAHRFAFEDVNGPVPEGKQLHHECRTRRCVRPSHLEALTPKEHATHHPQVTP